jgi:lipopolysaccharide assembly outer membrane protein LptD (OstA)
MKFTATLAVAAALLAACNPQPQHAQRAAVATPTPASGLPPLKITGRGNAGAPARFSEQIGNRKLYEGTARSYVSHSAQNMAQATFQEATVTFYDKDGTSLTAIAPQAAVDDRTNQVTLSGGVHAKTSTGATLTCDRLSYDRSTSLVTGTGNVRMTAFQDGQREVLTGNTFTSDIKLTRMVMK